LALPIIFGGQIVTKVKQVTQDALIQANPIEVALTLPLSWDDGDILSEELMAARLEKEIASFNEDQRESIRTSIYRDPQYHARKFLAQDKAWEFAVSQGWITDKSYRSQVSKFIVLCRVTDKESTHSLAIELARQFELPTNFDAPGAMWDHLCDRRLSEEFVLALYGDDRWGDEGEYFLCLSYCHQTVDHVFFPNHPCCGAF
jgi:hypothetical protein